ncbi:MAG: hypothetical protein VX475_14890, partial [Myxococcota bacterium]|nr:hypothetical protein [Myxococcota bacterium]
MLERGLFDERCYLLHGVPVEADAVFKDLIGSEDLDDFLIDEASVSDSVDLDGQDLALSINCLVPDPVQAADPLLNLIGPPRDAIENERARGLEV